MASFKPAYLIHGDDHGRIAERRARLRELAERESGSGGVELFEGEGASVEVVVAALNAMTFAIGRRFLIVDGTERWKDRELEPLSAAMAQLPPDTTVAFFAREDGRAKAPAKLHDAVRSTGGDIAAESGVKPWELPQWLVGEGRRLGLGLSVDAARALVAGVGERQQRLLRELEKLALELGAAGGAQPVAVDAQRIAESTARSAERRAWTLADALLSGDPAQATATYLQLRLQGERLPGLIYWVSARLRQAHQVAVALEQGQSPAQAKKLLRMGPKAAERLLADARRAGVKRLRAAIERVADLELASRGGGAIAAEETHMLLAIDAIAD